MTKKYEKPNARELGDLVVAAGACTTSGNFPTEQCATGAYHTGACNTGSSFPSVAKPLCSNGGGATQCTANGNFATPF